MSFLNDLQHDLDTYEIDHSNVDEDLTVLHSVAIKCLDKHAPIKAKRVKSIQLPEWYTSEIGQARIARDKYKRLKQWTEYKCFRNKTRNLIKSAKRKHFTTSVENLKDTKTLWRH